MGITYTPSKDGTNAILLRAHRALPQQHEVRWTYSQDMHCEHWALRYGFVPDGLQNERSGLGFSAPPRTADNMNILEEPRIAEQVLRFGCVRENTYTLDERLVSGAMQKMLPRRLLQCGRLLALAWHAAKALTRKEREKL